MKELDLKVVGHNAVRLDGLEKITATATYAHATIKGINRSDAEQVPGVHAVLSGEDCPGRCGLYLKDSQLFARDRVRYVGQQVAAVVASSQEIADKAIDLIKVEYEPLPVLQDPIEALKPDAVLIHPDLGDYEVVPWLYPQPGTNVAHLRKIRKGNVEKAFEEADYIVEDWYHVPHVVHAPIETHVSAALYTFDGRLTMWNSTQSPHTQRNILANVLNLKHKDVRIITPYVGGGFGDKAGVNMEVIAAACAMKVPGHPVKIRYSRKDEFQNTSQRQELKAYVKMGVKKDGK